MFPKHIFEINLVSSCGSCMRTLTVCPLFMIASSMRFVQVYRIVKPIATFYWLSVHISFRNFRNVFLQFFPVSIFGTFSDLFGSVFCNFISRSLILSSERDSLSFSMLSSLSVFLSLSLSFSVSFPLFVSLSLSLSLSLFPLSLSLSLSLSALPGQQIQDSIPLS